MTENNNTDFALTDSFDSYSITYSPDGIILEIDEFENENSFYNSIDGYFLKWPAIKKIFIYECIGILLYNVITVVSMYTIDTPNIILSQLIIKTIIYLHISYKDDMYIYNNGDFVLTSFIFLKLKLHPINIFYLFFIHALIYFGFNILIYMFVNEEIYFNRINYLLNAKQLTHTYIFSIIGNLIYFISQCLFIKNFNNMHDNNNNYLYIYNNSIWIVLINYIHPYISIFDYCVLVGITYFGKYEYDTLYKLLIFLGIVICSFFISILFIK